MPQLTPEGRRKIEEVAARHQVSAEAALTLLSALVAGHGDQAQFNHPELGGMGQWSRGGMTMIGDMFNNALKARVDAICTELSTMVKSAGVFAAPAQSQSQSQGSGGSAFFSPDEPSRWWPAELGVPASVGAQNDFRYAYFPAARRLVVEEGGRVGVYDTGEHRISGVSQQQGGSSDVAFTSQLGRVRTADLSRVAGGSGLSRTEPAAARPAEPAAMSAALTSPAPASDAPPAPSRSSAAAAGEDDIFAKIERLAELRGKGILTEDEYSAKKAELLSRL